jgi:deoxyribonuclease-4
MRLGAHQSIAGGYETAIRLAEEDGCEALQVFTKVSNQWRERTVSAEEAAPFRAGVARLGLAPVLSHASYLINLSSDKDDVRDRSVEALGRELRRCHALGIAYLVLHPGAHMGQGEATGIARACAGLDGACRAADADGPVGVEILLENTAGQGSALGRSFEQIAALIAGSGCRDRLGVCFDTCHAYAAGYDWTTAAGYAETFAHFDRTIGLDRLRAFHLNDCKRPKGKKPALGGRVDRHARVGDGVFGCEPFARLLHDSRFARHPAVLETPPDGEDRAYRGQIERLRAL